VKEVYPSWPTVIMTSLVLFLSWLMVFLEVGISKESIITGVLFLIIGVWIVLSAMRKFPLYRMN
jgi:hypothetical protein